MKFKLLVMIGLVVILSGCYNREWIKCDFEKYKKSIGMDDINEWTCKMLVSGVIYDKELDECIYKQNNACKNPYPFSSIEECEDVCSKKLNEEKYSVPILTEKDAILFTKEWLDNHRHYSEDCRACNLTGYIDFRYDYWRMEFSCECYLSFDVNVTDIDFSCITIPECGDEYAICEINKGNCSTDLDCREFDKNRPNCASVCRKGSCEVCCTETWECPGPCIKLV